MNRNTLILPGAIIIVLALTYTLFDMTQYPEITKGHIYALITGLFLLFLATLIQALFPAKETYDYDVMNRPYLEPRLRVNKSANSIYTFKYIIENLGKYAAHDILIMTKSDGFMSAEYESVDSRELATHAKMTYNPSRIEIDVPDKAYLNFEILIIYTAVILNKERRYQSVFRFEVPSKHIPDEPIEYSSSQHVEEKNRNFKDEYIDPATQIEKSEGSMIFQFVEKELPKFSNTVFVKTMSTLIMYEPPTRNVIYARKIGPTVRFISMTMQDVEKKTNKIGITWSSEKISLAIDGRVNSVTLRDDS